MESQTVECTLNEQELAVRRRAIRERLLAKATLVQEIPEGFRLHFAAPSEIRDALDEFIALERQCCSFLDFAIDEGPPGSGLTLAVTGPEGTKDVIGDVLAGPASAATARRGIDRRWARSGLVVAGVALVCCFGPALLALLGISSAAALAGGELGEVVAITALSTPLLVWVWRKRAKDSAGAADCEC